MKWQKFDERGDSKVLMENEKDSLDQENIEGQQGNFERPEEVSDFGFKVE